MYLQNGNRLTDVEDTPVAAKGEMGWGRVNQELGTHIHTTTRKRDSQQGPTYGMALGILLNILR